MRFWILLLTLGLLFNVSQKPILAQGAWSCYWSNAGNQCGTSHSCDTGFEIPNPSPCNGLSQAQCSGSGSCVSAEVNVDLEVENGPSIDGGCIDTAIGCVPVLSDQGLAGFFLGWGMGIGGGIALILMVVAAYMIMSSAGDPRKLQAGKELLTSAVTGLMLLLFSAYILRFIGVDLLGIL